LAARSEIVVLSQVDAATEEQLQDYTRQLRAAGVAQVYLLSAVAGRGLPPLLDAIWLALRADET